MTHFFGLHPWDVGGPQHLTEAETVVYREATVQMIQARRAQAQQP